MNTDCFEAIAPFSLTDVAIDDRFWISRLEILRNDTMEVVYENLETSGRIENIRIASDAMDGEFNGRYYNDSDVYK